MTKLFISILGSILLLVLVSNCKNTVTNEILPPPQVKFVEKSPDSAAVETGIDAEEPPGVLPDPNKNAIFLQWHPVEHEGLQSYDVYRRAIDSTGNFLKIAEVLQAFGSRDTTYMDTSAQLQTLYYYYIVARDERGEEGERSKTEHYTLLPKPRVNIPVGNTLFSGFFDWTFQNSYVPQFFIFRLERQVAGNEYTPVQLKLLELNNIVPDQRWTAQELGLSPLAPGNYRWRIDIRVLRDNRQGAESEWGLFQVQ